MYTENYDQEINLKDLFFSVLYRWRVLLLTAVLGALVMGGYKGMQANEPQVQSGIEVDHEAKLVEYDQEKMVLEKSAENIEKSIEEQNRYIVDAPLMQINPYNESVSVAEVLVEMTDAEKPGLDNLLNCYQYALLDGAYMETAAEKLGTEQRYLRELLNVEGRSEFKGSMLNGLIAPEMQDGLLRISVVGADREMTEKVLSFVLDEMETLQTEFNTKIGKHKLTILRKTTGEQVDTKLLSRQQSTRGNIAALKKSLEDFNNSIEGLQVPQDIVTEGGSMNGAIKYAAVGFVAGGFVAAFAVCMMFILNDKVISDKEVENRFRLKSLGGFSQVMNKRKFSFVDNWLHRLSGDDKTWSEDAVFEMIITNLSNYAGDKESLFITGLASQEFLEKVCSQLCVAFPDIKIESERDMIENASARRRMVKCKGIILVEERGISRYSDIRQELEIAGNVGAEVIGVIVG